MTPRTLSAAAIAVALAVAAAIAQQGQQQPRQGGQQSQQQPTQAPGAVAGQVMSSTTGEPLRKVILTLQPVGGRGGQGGAQPVSASSDSSGNFRFLSVVPGEYQLRGERTGFVRGVYGEDQPGGEARRISVSSGQTASGIQLKLIPHSVVIGRVYDEDGDPIEGAFVQVQRYTYNRNGRTLSTAQQGTTNDIGEYRVAGLPPGRYYVSANGRGGGGRGGRGRGGPFFGDADPNAIDEGYATTYYPRVADPNGATPIDLVPGSELRGIDIGLITTRLYTISGSIDGVPVGPVQLPPELEQLRVQAEELAQQFGKAGKAAKAKGIARGLLDNAANVQVNLIPRQQNGLGGRGGGGPVLLDRQRGTFEIRGVAPGSYYLIAQTRAIGGPQQQLTARVPVDVASGDISNLVVRLMPPLAITGKVLAEREDPNLKLSAVRVNFGSIQPSPGGNPGRIQVADDGTFTTTLSPNEYTVEMGGAPAGYYLKAVKFASREVPNAQLDLSSTGGPVELVIANDAGTISGRVNNSRGEPAASVRVTAVPVDSERRDLFKSVTAGEDGSFTISTVPPGRYKIYAWEDIEGSAWMDAQFRRPFDNLAENVDVRSNMTPNLTLKLIERAQLAAAGVQ